MLRVFSSFISAPFRLGPTILMATLNAASSVEASLDYVLVETDVKLGANDL